MCGHSSEIYCGKKDVKIAKRGTGLPGVGSWVAGLYFFLGYGRSVSGSCNRDTPRALRNDGGKEFEFEEEASSAQAET
jgi:hypothetical protein